MRNAAFLGKACKKIIKVVPLTLFNYHPRIGRNKNRESRVNYRNQMRRAKNCALKLTWFLLKSQVFVFYSIAPDEVCSNKSSFCQVTLKNNAFNRQNSFFDCDHNIAFL